MTRSCHIKAGGGGGERGGYRVSSVYQDDRDGFHVNRMPEHLRAGRLLIPQYDVY